ncbi:2593_t:CDS:2, partial [Acaulospora colombiana]
ALNEGCRRNESASWWPDGNGGLQVIASGGNSLKQNQGQKLNQKNKKALSKAHETCSLDQPTSPLLQQEKVPSQQGLIVLPTITEEKENRQNDRQKPVISNTGSSNLFTPHWNGSTTKKNSQRAATTSPDEIIYSTSSSYSTSLSSSSGTSAFSMDNDPALPHLFCGLPSDEMTIVPPSGLTEMEERRMIEASDISHSPEDDGDADDEEDCDAIIGRGMLVPAAVFLSNPSVGANRDASSIKLVKIIEEDEEVHSAEIPERSHPIVKSLST